MGSDDLFWKKKNLKRKSKNKGLPPNSFLIVCEGEKTEPNYFKTFSRKLHSVTVQIEGCGMNTRSLVKRTLEISEKARIDGEEFDQVWCVFDKDDNPLNNFKAALELAEKNKIKVAYSNEAFELWYLLHFNYHDTAMPRDDYKRKLSTYLKFPYKKNSQDIYEVIVDKQEKAIKNAERLLKNYNPPNPGLDNPSTTVYLLVQELNRFLPK